MIYLLFGFLAFWVVFPKFRERFGSELFLEGTGLRMVRMRTPGGDGQGHTAFGNVFIVKEFSEKAHAAGKSSDVFGDKTAMRSKQAETEKGDSLANGRQAGFSMVKFKLQMASQEIGDLVRKGSDPGGPFTQNNPYTEEAS